MTRNTSNLTQEDWDKIKNWLEDDKWHHCPGLHCCRCDDLFPEVSGCPCNILGTKYVVHAVATILEQRGGDKDALQS